MGLYNITIYNPDIIRLSYQIAAISINKKQIGRSNIMIIDFHTHIFADNLAQKALSTVLTNINYIYKPVTNATKADLLKKMDAWGIDISVVQPVITKQSQTQKVNQWASRICSDRLIFWRNLSAYRKLQKRY